MESKQMTPADEGIAAVRAEMRSALSLLIVCEDEEGNYEPIGEAYNESEAREIIDSVMRGKMKTLAADGDPGICPYIWKGFTRTASGRYTEVWRVLEATR
jgi:hypothetical protein